MLTSAHDGSHYYRFDLSDWWCGTCNTITDNCDALMYGASDPEDDGPHAEAPCVVCLATAKGDHGIRRASQPWPRTRVNGRTVHKCCAHEAEHLVASADDFAVDGDGAMSWKGSGSYWFADTVRLAVELYLVPDTAIQPTEAKRADQAAERIAAYRAAQPDQATPEQRAEMLAAFGPGERVVDALSGRVTYL
jgi:hypothetical protein